MANKHTVSDLYQMQSLPLSAKIQMTRQRIRGWIDEFSEDGVYISFSGGKDSTVLLDLVRKDYPNVEAVYVDTGLEYPEIREFVKSFENVTILKPKMNFRQVIEKYGYPFISKEVSETVHCAKHSKEGKWKTTRIQRINGELKTPDGRKSPYNCEKYNFLLKAPFDISNRCCNVMKKAPVHQYAKETDKKPITAQMASESRLRMQNWLQNGCNGFNMKSPISNPMAFWTEQDVLLYIKMNNLPICSVYGEIVEDTEIKGQMNVFDYEEVVTDKLFETDAPILKTTGCKRTGCMFCGYGAHCKGDTRFLDMKSSHPKTYEWIMKPWEEGGLNYKEVIDWINQNGNLNIKY